MPFIIQQDFLPSIPITGIELFAKEQESIDRILRSVVLDRDIMDKVFLKQKLQSLKKAWIDKTFFEPSITKILDDPNFKRIVEMGEPIIPLIIEDIDKDPSILVWALNAITGRHVQTGTQRMSIPEACKAWVKLSEIK